MIDWLLAQDIQVLALQDIRVPQQVKLGFQTKLRRHNLHIVFGDDRGDAQGRHYVGLAIVSSPVT